MHADTPDGTTLPSDMAHPPNAAAVIIAGFHKERRRQVHFDGVMRTNLLQSGTPAILAMGSLLTTSLPPIYPNSKDLDDGNHTTINHDH